MVIKTLKMMVSLVTSGTVILPSVAQEAASNKIEGNPNILLIMVDDLGLGDLSCQYAKDVQTPNIDRLFHQGVRMDNFYANSSVSSPSRAGLLTGCFPDMVGVPGVIRTDPKGSWGYLSPDATLLPEMMKKPVIKLQLSVNGIWDLRVLIYPMKEVLISSMVSWET